MLTQDLVQFKPLNSENDLGEGAHLKHIVGTFLGFSGLFGCSMSFFQHLLVWEVGNFGHVSM